VPATVVTAHLFVGPTLPATEIGAPGLFLCLPPAAHGDVLRSARARPRAIGIIDGYFDGVPAVWHKEILWALAQGIHVFGSASMGALRAAELHEFGMRGVGRIFEAYRAGELEDDDEVAVMHGPAATGYVTLSEPMVNIRATLEQAERAAIVTATTRAALIERAKNLFYPERSWERLLGDGAADALAGETQRLRDWLPIGRVDQKRLDAQTMIGAMREFLAGDPAPMHAMFKFEWTDMWDIAIQSTAGRPAIGAATGEPLRDEWVLDELRLDEVAFDSMRLRASLRRLATDGRSAPSSPLDPAARRAAEQRLRLRLGLFRRSDLDRWCAQNDLEPAHLARLIDEEARLAEMDAHLAPDFGRDLLDQLRLGGDYPRLLARARDKRALLAARGQEDATANDIGLTPIALVAWHFERRLDRPIPDDLEAHARRLGLERLADFYRALAREWLYSNQGKVEADRK
jgi:hypothetical protein